MDFPNVAVCSNLKHFSLCFRKVQELSDDGRIHVTASWSIECFDKPYKISFCEFIPFQYSAIFHTATYNNIMMVRIDLILANSASPVPFCGLLKYLYGRFQCKTG